MKILIAKKSDPKADTIALEKELNNNQVKYFI
jgi:hypothetical protein